MYHVTKTTHIRLPGGRSVVLREGPRGVVHDPDGNPVDLDAGLERALGADTLKDLLTKGVIRKE